MQQAMPQSSSPGSGGGGKSPGGVSVHTPVAPSSPLVGSPLSTLSSLSTTPRRPSFLTLSSTHSERFKQGESEFLGRSPATPTRVLRIKSEELTMDSLQAGAESPGLGSVDEKAPFFPSLSPRPPPGSGTGSPVSARSHARRPSYMQATQQELLRQAEARDAALARERRAEEERLRTTRRAHGMTATDLYRTQQAELEARRMAVLEKEEAERQNARLAFVAKYEAEFSTPVAERAAARAKSIHNSPSGPQSSRSVAAAAHAAAVAAAAATAAAAAIAAATALQLQEELDRREMLIRQDAAQAAALRSSGAGLAADETSDSSSDDDSERDYDSDSSVTPSEGELEAQADAVESANNGATRAKRNGIKPRPDGRPTGGLSLHSTASLAASTIASPVAAAASPRLHLHHHHQHRRHHRPTHSSTLTPLTGSRSLADGGGGLGPESEDDDESETTLKLHAPTSVADIYNPALVRHERMNITGGCDFLDPIAASVASPSSSSSAAAAGVAAGSGSDPHSVAGLDLLMKSRKFRRDQKRAARVRGGSTASANMATGFGRLTEAQIERSIDQHERKKQIERHAAEGKTNHKHAVEQVQQQQQQQQAAAQSAQSPTKKPLFPALRKAADQAT